MANLGKLISVDFPALAGARDLPRGHGTGNRAPRFYAEQVLDHLNGRMRDFIGRQEMMFVATADERGAGACAQRTGPAGFVRVYGASLVAWPEFRAGGGQAGLDNVGLFFVDFFREAIGLHVNGAAKIVTVAAMRDAHPDLPPEPVPGRRVRHWVLMHVEEAYIRSTRHIPPLVKLPTGRPWGGDGGGPAFPQ